MDPPRLKNRFQDRPFLTVFASHPLPEVDPSRLPKIQAESNEQVSTVIIVITRLKTMYGVFPFRRFFGVSK
jgi:hypothetical protein